MTYEEDRAFQQAVSEGLVPKLMDSRVCVSFAPTEDEIDAKFAVELGAMIMLDKPIITIVRPGMTISKKLEMVSDKIVHADISTEAGRELLTEAISDFAAEQAMTS